MLANTLPLLLLGACATTAQLPAAEQPQLAQLAQPYARQLQAVGVTRVISPGKGGVVRLETAYGSVYLPYPATAEPVAFELDIGREDVHATAETFDRVRDERMLAALVPEALRVVAANNRFGAARADPWH